MYTGSKYRTRMHYHLDWTYQEEGQRHFPRSRLMVVQAGDGRWYIEQECGDEYSGFAGVVKSDVDLVTEPNFYADLETVARAAFALMKQVYPAYKEEALDRFLAAPT
ncbi:hypothetical protein [Paraburkholderia sp. J8-2]|uniref:hypothetical protein n=1 Tax=Paraburkholderia sp. J8-2 TaxID=2805440 RepID=UPI002AB639E8|nr:hypothetical protein [Paraburkholderia sp. J8-2]